MERPALAIHIGFIAALWVTVEVELGELLATMLKDEASLSVPMYMAIKSEAARTAAVKAVATESLDAKLLEEYEALMKKVIKTSSQRDKVVHGLWMVPKNNMDTLVLINPRIALPVVATAKAKIAPMMMKEYFQDFTKARQLEALGAVIKILKQGQVLINSLLAYKEKDFIDIENRIKAVRQEIDNFSKKVSSHK